MADNEPLPFWSKIEGELGERSLRVRVQEAFESLIYKSVRVVAEAFLIR